MALQEAHPGKKSPQSFKSVTASLFSLLWRTIEAWFSGGKREGRVAAGTKSSSLVLRRDFSVVFLYKFGCRLQELPLNKKYFLHSGVVWLGQCLFLALLIHVSFSFSQCALQAVFLLIQFTLTANIYFYKTWIPSEQQVNCRWKHLHNPPHNDTVHVAFQSGDIWGLNLRNHLGSWRSWTVHHCTTRTSLWCLCTCFHKMEEHISEITLNVSVLKALTDDYRY